MARAGIIRISDHGGWPCSPRNVLVIIGPALKQSCGLARMHFSADFLNSADFLPGLSLIRARSRSILAGFRLVLARLRP
jgi:hypothetical protein